MEKNKKCRHFSGRSEQDSNEIDGRELFRFVVVPGDWLQVCAPTFVHRIFAVRVRSAASEGLPWRQRNLSSHLGLCRFAGIDDLHMGLNPEWSHDSHFLIHGHRYILFLSTISRFIVSR